MTIKKLTERFPDTDIEIIKIIYQDGYKDGFESGVEEGWTQSENVLLKGEE